MSILSTLSHILLRIYRLHKFSHFFLFLNIGKWAFHILNVNENRTKLLTHDVLIQTWSIGIEEALFSNEIAMVKYRQQQTSVNVIHK